MQHLKVTSWIPSQTAGKTEGVCFSEVWIVLLQPVD